MLYISPFSQVDFLSQKSCALLNLLIKLINLVIENFEMYQHIIINNIWWLLQRKTREITKVIVVIRKCYQWNEY